MAREGIKASFTEDPLDYTEYKNLGVYQQAPGVFVSIYEHGTLRGSMGITKTSQPLYVTVPQYARAACFDDTRFRPIKENDVDSLKIVVTLISALTKRDTTNPSKLLSNIDIGTHGLMIETESGSAVLFPETFERTGCTKENAFQMLCREAGLPEDAWKDPRYTIYSFETQSFSE